MINTNELKERVGILETALSSMIAVLDSLDVYNKYTVIRAYARSALDTQVTVLTQKESIKLLRKSVFRAIDNYQDMTSWQPQESRNALICEIRDRVDLLFEVFSNPT